MPPAAQTEFVIEQKTPSLPPVETFAELNLPLPLLKALTSAGVNAPFPIQSATLPDSMAGRDVLGRGRTGSGKTLAFGLPIVMRTAGKKAQPKMPLALVLVPTRELAQQVTEAIYPYARSMQLKVATVVGGMSIQRQIVALRQGAEILVATPGRLHDLIERRTADLSQVEITVLDEADQMADMGFLPQVTKLLDQVKPDGQRMLFSATLDRGVDRLVRRFLVDPVTHSVDPHSATVTTMEHHVLHVDVAHKQDVATEIAAREGRVIMFVDTKRGADKLTKHLLSRGVHASALHGGKSQPQRTRTLDQFKSGKVTALIATNVAARGIHIDGLDLVVNVDAPTDPKDYLHRGGRTARAGESGSVVTLVLPSQRREMTRLMSAAGVDHEQAKVAPGDATLIKVTGARAPSGVPVTVRAPESESIRSPRPRRGAPAGGASSGRPRTGARPAGERPKRIGLDGADPTAAGYAGRRGRRPENRRPRAV